MEGLAAEAQRLDACKVVGRILLVACSATARTASPAAILWPSSRTRIKDIPPSSMSTSIREAPASKAFSTSSFTALAGRSMTSPAAILCATSAGNRRTLPPATPYSAVPSTRAGGRGSRR